MKLSKIQIRKIVESVINEDVAEDIEKNIKDAIKSMDPGNIASIFAAFPFIMYYHKDNIMGAYEREGASSAASVFLDHYNEVLRSVNADPVFKDMFKDII